MGRDPLVVQSSELMRIGKMPKLSDVKGGKVSQQPHPLLPPQTQFVDDASHGKEAQPAPPPARL